MSRLVGKKGLIVGVANERSIAWGAIKACMAEGAEIIGTYTENMKKRAAPLLEEHGVQHLECDVSRSEDLDKLFEFVKKEFETLDFVVHSVAFANKDTFNNLFVDVTREHFMEAMNVSCYSFVTIMKRASSLMKAGGVGITYSFLGSQRITGKYNVMGVCKAALESSMRYIASDLGRNSIRVNAISAGAIRTISSFGVKEFEKLKRIATDLSLTGQAISIEDVGDLTAFLVSDQAKGITGQTIYIDGGSSSVSIPSNLDFYDV